MKQLKPDDGELADKSEVGARTASSAITGIVKTAILFVVVALPSLFMVLWTFDAPLIAGADAFIFSALQVVFIGMFLGYRAWRS